MVRRSGLGLVEVLFTLLLLSLAIIPIFGMLSGNVQHVAFNSDRAVAQMLAQQVMERYRFESTDYLRKSFSQESDSQSVLANDSLLNHVLKQDESFAKYSQRYARKVLFESTDESCGKLICTVTWESKGRKSELSLRTFVYDKGGM